MSRFLPQRDDRDTRDRHGLLFGGALAAALLILALVLWWVLTPAPPPGRVPEPAAELPRINRTPREAPPDSVSRAPEIILAPGQEGDFPLDVRPPATVSPPPVPPAPDAFAQAAPRPGAGALESALLPLVVGPAGIGRRAPPPESRRTAIVRAESLLAARLASLPGTRRTERGAVGLANGGVTVAIPWGGFLPANRRDGKWREERCKGKDAGKADKPGERQARRARCR